MASKSSREEWPTEFKATKVSDSFMGKELTFFFVTGVVNRNQYKYVEEAINVLAVHEIDEDKILLSTLLNQEQLEGIPQRLRAPLEDMEGAVLLVGERNRRCLQGGSAELRGTPA